MFHEAAKEHDLFEKIIIKKEEGESEKEKESMLTLRKRVR